MPKREFVQPKIRANGGGADRRLAGLDRPDSHGFLAAKIPFWESVTATGSPSETSCIDFQYAGGKDNANFTPQGRLRKAWRHQ